MLCKYELTRDKRFLFGDGDCVSYLQTETPKPVTLAELGCVPRRGQKRALFECLIVTHVDQRAGVLRQAAQDGGWDPLLCRDAESAATWGARRRLGLAVVDLDGAPAPTLPRLRRLSELLTAPSGPLVMLFGHENDPAEEIWARQLGVWLYLPAVDERSDLIPLFRDALAIVQKTSGNVVHQNESHGKRSALGDQPTRRT